MTFSWHTKARLTTLLFNPQDNALLIPTNPLKSSALLRSAQADASGICMLGLVTFSKLRCFKIWKV